MLSAHEMRMIQKKGALTVPAVEAWIKTCAKRDSGEAEFNAPLLPSTVEALLDAGYSINGDPRVAGCVVSWEKEA